MVRITKKSIVLTNQVAGYLFIDIANACCKKYDEVILFTGDVIPLYRKLDERVVVARIPKYNRRNIGLRLLSWLMGTFSIYWKLIWVYRNSELLISSNPPIASSLLPVFLTRKVSLIIYDVYPDGLVAGGFVSKKSVLFKVWAEVNRFAYKKVDEIVTLTSGMATAISQYCPTSRVTIIPAWSALNEPITRVPEQSNLFIEKNRLQGKFLVMYSGNLGKEYNLSSIVLLAEACRNIPGLVFVIAGKGWQAQTLGEQIHLKGLRNCLLLPYQPAEEFIHSLHAFHVGIVSLASSVSMVAIPSKTFNILACGRPVLCIGDTESDLGVMLRKNAVGVTFDAEQIEEMKEWIIRIQKDRNYFDELSANALALSKKHFFSLAEEIVRIISCANAH